jgi:PHD/YefM family antitoxin component YafN of YafNO toxin-antitoxin module
MMTEIDANAVTDFLSQHEVDEPIVIKRQGTPHAVMIPYDIFHAMHRENRQALRVDELTDEDIEAILDSKPPTGHGRSNGNFDD